MSICCKTILAQKEGNIWTFADHCSINFNDTTNIVIDSSADGIMGGHFPVAENSSLSDSSDNLFCYTTGVNWNNNSLFIYDRTHHVMPNGSNLQGNGIFTSLLLTSPGIDSLIYVLHFGSNGASGYSWFFYSLINKNLNGGLGDVELRDSMIYYGRLSSQKLAACKHANGRDWWIFILDRDSGYVSFLLTPYGLDHINSQNIGSASDSLFFGKLIFSNDGTKMMAVSNAGIVDVFDFDRCTGLLSNCRDIGEHLISQQYQYNGATFSPNGNVIYTSSWNTVKVFYQWDLNAGNINAIRASKTLLNQYPDTGEVIDYTYFWQDLAPNGKIYIPICNNYFAGGNTNVTHHLDVIEFPDSVGSACHYVRQGFSLNGHRVCGNMPNMAYYGLGEDSGSVCDSLFHVGIIEANGSESGIEVFPNPFYNKVSFHPLQSSAEKILIEVFNEIGENVFRKETTLKDQEINLGQLTKGVYFLNVKSEKFSLTKKIVKL